MLIFPDLNAANIGYKLIQKLSETAVLGPRRAAHALPRSATVEDVVRMTALVVMDVQRKANDRRSC
ncbi:MAG: phosphate acyltransferase [Acidobacteria bacterium]|nr:phosphate acyltransferase [Acidobacteriota bacterium]MDW7984463.1 phosphate acyltransferase [Acidobacteriota bacterium]